MRRTICTVKPWVLQSYRSSLPEFINIVTAACQTLQRHLWSFMAASQGDVEAQYDLAKMYEDQETEPLQTGLEVFPETRIPQPKTTRLLAFTGQPSSGNAY